MERPVTFRQLPAEEWERLRPIYESQGDALPAAENHTAIVAEINGEIVGMWGVNLIVHAGPLWVAPSWRGHGVSDGMAITLDDTLRGAGSDGYFMFPSNPNSERVAVRLGLTPVDLKIYKRGF